MKNNSYKSTFRIYWEDTDAGGVVYYANYLKFAERARTEMLRALGIKQSELLEKEGIAFVVRHAEIDLMKPARLDDVVEIFTHTKKILGASIEMEQKIFIGKTELAIVHVIIACVDKNFKPARLPKKIKDIFNN